MNKIICNSLNRLRNKKIPNPELDLRILLSSASIHNKNIFLNNFNIEDIDLNKFNSLISKRLNNQPISKILNKKSFWKSDFFVDSNVLDPRPETELIVEETLNNYKNKDQKLKILDIGTGSGCLSISLAKEFPNSSVTAIDISKEALTVAKKNIILNRLDKRIELKLCEFYDLMETYDIIVSNPPYLSEDDFEKTQLEIKKFEPKISLVASENGLSFYKLFARNIEKIMNENSHFIIEIGHNQLDSCRSIFSNSNLKLKKISKDIQKIDRTLTFIKI
tara:strand:+ start:4189 stop:5019 length:831 start_codon:yes stop_codon:yes gene_type:complete